MQNNNSKLKFSIIFLTIFFVAFFMSLLISNQAFAWVADEGFEHSGGWGNFTPTASYPTNIKEITSAEKHTGTYSAHAQYNEAANSPGHMYSTNYGVGSAWGTDDVYIRVYLKFDSGFKFPNIYKIWKYHGTEPLYLNLKSHGADYGSSSAFIELWFSGTLVVPDIIRWDDQSRYKIITAGAGWYYIEVHFKSSTQKVSVWWKAPGAESATKILTDADCSSYSLGHSEHFTIGYINSVHEGAAGGDMWFDDIAISNSYIGPMEMLSDTTPPAAPTGVVVR